MRKKVLLLLLLGLFTKSFGQFTEGFENGIPEDWTIINGGEVTTWGHITNTVQPTEPFWIHSGNGAAGISMLYWSQDDYLVTPAITVVAGVNDRISFWCARFAFIDIEEGMEVLISTTTPDVAGLAPIDEVHPELTNYDPFYKKYYYDLSGYAGQTIYMGFRATHTQFWRLMIDDFTNDALPTAISGCGTITYPENGATNVDTVGLLKWEAVPGANGYALMLGTTPGGAEIYGALDVSDVTSKAIGPLELATTYYATIIPYNNMGVAVGCTEYSFTTRSEILGDVCSTAIDLSTLTSPLTSTTVGAGDDDFACYLWTAPDIYYKVEVPNGSTLSIRQTHNSYQSANTIFYGGCTNRTEIYCGIALDLYNAFAWKNTTGADQTVYWVQYGAGLGWNDAEALGEYTIEWSIASCDFPTVAYQTVSNCDVAPGFFANVEITNMGSASTLQITDNQGSVMQTATTAGVVQFGPYAVGTPVVFTITNATEASCFINSNPITLATCPPNCSDAIVLNEGEPTDCLIGSGAGGWNFNGSSIGKEKLYSFTPTITGKYAVETVWDGENMDEFPINAISLFYKEADDTCGAGWNFITMSEMFGNFISSENLIAGTEYLLLLDAIETTGSYNKFQISYQPPPCNSAVVTHTIITECEEDAEFYVDVNVESLGTATFHTLWLGTVNGTTIFDEVTSTGIIHLGPFAYGTFITYSLTNESGCPAVYGGNITQAQACPNFYPSCTTLTYPENEAEDVTLNNFNGLAEIVFTWEEAVGTLPTVGYSIYVGTTPTALDYILNTPDAFVSLIGFTANTTYYWKAVPNNSLLQAADCEVYSFTTGEFIPNGYCLNGVQYLGGLFTPLCMGDTEIINGFAFAGTYDNLTVTEGVTYEFSSTGTNPLGIPDLVTIGTEDGTTPLAWGTSPLTWTANLSGNVRFYLHLSALCESQELYRERGVRCGVLSKPTYDISALRAYPNPTKDILNLGYLNGIKELSVFNILGQEVMVKTVNNTAFQLDMKSLSSGTYLIKVLSDDNAIKTIKVIKE